MIPSLTKRDIVVCKGGEKHRVAEKPELLWGIFCDKKPVFRVVLCNITCSERGQMQLYYCIDGKVFGDTHNDFDVVRVISK